MTEGQDSLIIELLDNYKAVTEAAFMIATEAWIELDLTMAQVKTLVVLEREGPITVGRIAERLRIGMPASSHLVEKLVQAGFAERVEDREDRRRTLVHLLPSGKELLTHLRQGKRQHLRNWMMQLDNTDMMALKQGLEALAKVIQGSSAATDSSDE